LFAAGNLFQHDFTPGTPSK
jgi:hypothetical protein